jgi:hypothetical protein
LEGPSFNIHIPSSAASSIQSLVSFSLHKFGGIQVEVCPFWASLFASNVTAADLNDDAGYESNLNVISLSACKGIHPSALLKGITMGDLWNQKATKNPFTSMVAVSKDKVAVSFGKCLFFCNKYSNG